MLPFFLTLNPHSTIKLTLNRVMRVQCKEKRKHDLRFCPVVTCDYLLLQLEVHPLSTVITDIVSSLVRPHKKKFPGDHPLPASAVSETDRSAVVPPVSVLLCFTPSDDYDDSTSSSQQSKREIYREKF